MDDAQLTMTFDGDATSDHLIDAKDLAPAMLHLAEAVERAGQIVAPDVKVKLSVRATNDGSFVVDFLISLDTLGAFFTTPAGVAVSSVAGIAGAVIGAVSLIKGKKHHGGNPTTTTLDDNSVEVVYPDGYKVTSHRRHVQVANDSIAADALRAMLNPLEVDGLDSVELATKYDKVTVTADELVAFGSGLVKDAGILQVERQKSVVMQAANVSFSSDKWRLLDGKGSPFFVTVEDREFLDRVDADVEVFGKHDVFIVDLRKEFRVDKNERLKADVFIERVVRHMAIGDIEPPLPDAV